MKFKGMLKFALSALLLAAGVSAFADGPLTLSDKKTKVTWEQFAGVINNPSSLKGKGTVASDNAAIAAALEVYNEKQGVVSTDSTTLVTKNGLLTTAQNTLNSTAEGSVKDNLDKAIADTVGLGGDLAEAQANLQEYINGLEKVYTDSVAFLATKRELLSAQQTKQGTLNTNLTQAQGDYNNAKSDYNNYVSQISLLPRKKITEVSTVKWLSDISAAANAFKTAYAGLTATPPVTDDIPRIFYKTVSVYNEEDEQTTTTMYVAYVSSPGTGWKEATAAQFRRLFITVDGVAGDFAGASKPINSLRLYLGADYEKLNPGNTDITVTWNGLKSNIASAAADQIQTLADNQKYQVVNTTTTNEVEDDYKSEETRLIGLRDAAKAEMDKYYRQIYGWHPTSEGWEKDDTEVVGINEQLATVNAAIEVYQEEIDNLTNTVNPALKQKWEAAKNGTLQGDEEYNRLKTEITNAQNELSTKMSAYNTAKEAYDEAEQAVTDAQAEVTAAENALETSRAALVAAAKDVASARTTAQNEADEALLAVYTNGFTLTGDITVDTPITANYSGNIIGGMNVINLAAGNNYVFTSAYSGTLVNAAVNLNGGSKFAQIQNNAKFEEVAVWTGSQGRFYDGNGDGVKFANGTSSTTNLYELGYVARDFFGISYDTNNANSKLAKLDDETKVYYITPYTIAGNNTSYYVNYIDGEFVNKTVSGLNITGNMFFSSATEDLADVEGIANLIYDTNKCKNVVIEDKVDFYAPFDITTTGTVTVQRTFTSGYNTVCLPFELNASYAAGIQYLCTYDTETPEKFWFTKREGAIAANTPVLMVNTSDVTLNIPAGTIIKKTENQIVEITGQTSEQSKSFGTLKLTGVDEFVGNYNSYKIYGLKGNKFVGAGEGASFPAFRSVISSAVATASEQAPRRIGIRDEKGIVIVDDEAGIENVAAEATSLEVTSAQGEIIINSEADYGEVAIYTLDGRVAAVANVMVGTTTVSVERGIYIVMGKKVMVK